MVPIVVFKGSTLPNSPNLTCQLATSMNIPRLLRVGRQSLCPVCSMSGTNHDDDDDDDDDDEGELGEDQ